MNKLIVVVLLAGLVAFSSCDKKAGSAKLKTDLDSVSYALGVNIAKSLQNGGLEEINYQSLNAGFRDVFEKKDVQIDEAASNGVINDYMMKLQSKQGEKNLEEGRAFLEENKTKEGVKSTASGLQYIVITEGTGVSPKATDQVKVHYTGTTTDGTVFDSSVERGEPAEFVLNRVIPGWTEALQLMKVGSKYKLFIPSELGYGANPRPGGAIKANQVLIFEVELLEVMPQDTTEMK